MTGVTNRRIRTREGAAQPRAGRLLTWNRRPAFFWRRARRWFTFIAPAIPLAIAPEKKKEKRMPIETLPTFPHAAGTRERRRHPRVTPDPLLVIRFASGTTGIVLDVSHEGLGFLASAPVPETQAVHFEISGRSTPRSEAAGQLMWKDSSGKRAGLRFTQVPEEMRLLIHQWLPAAEPARAFPNEPGAPLATNLAGEESAGALPPRHRKRMIFAANAVTFLLACFIALGIWGSLDHHREAGAPSRWMQGLAQRFSLRRGPAARMDLAKQAQSPMQASAKSQNLEPPPANANASSGTAASAENPPVALAAAASPDAAASLPSPAALDSSANLAASKSLKSAQFPVTGPAKEEASIAERPATPRPEAAGQAPLALAQELLQKDADPDQQGKAVQLLWQAVEKGNVAAEVALADLYLNGRGVAKSCSQARVLLTAAQNRKSETAAKKLDDFSQYGCD